MFILTKFKINTIFKKYPIRDEEREKNLIGWCIPEYQ